MGAVLRRRIPDKQLVLGLTVVAGLKSVSSYLRCRAMIWPYLASLHAVRKINHDKSIDKQTNQLANI